MRWLPIASLHSSRIGSALLTDSAHPLVWRCHVEHQKSLLPELWISFSWCNAIFRGEKGPARAFDDVTPHRCRIAREQPSTLATLGQGGQTGCYPDSGASPAALDFWLILPSCLNTFNVIKRTAKLVQMTVRALELGA